MVARKGYAWERTEIERSIEYPMCHISRGDCSHHIFTNLAKNSRHSFSRPFFFLEGNPAEDIICMALKKTTQIRFLVEIIAFELQVSWLAFIKIGSSNVVSRTIIKDALLFDCLHLAYHICETFWLSSQYEQNSLKSSCSPHWWPQRKTFFLNTSTFKTRDPMFIHWPYLPLCVCGGGGGLVRITEELYGGLTLLGVSNCDPWEPSPEFNFMTGWNIMLESASSSKFTWWQQAGG